jgi:hypothetical protein
MKTVTKFNLLLIGFILLNINVAKAWNQGSELNLKMYDNSAFSVFFDNNGFQYPDNRFSISNVNPGKHFLKVVKNMPTHRGMFTKVVYNGWINVPCDSKVFAVIGCYNDYKVVDLVSCKPTYGNYENETYSYGHDSGHGNKYGYKKEDRRRDETYNGGRSCETPSGPAYLVMSDNDFCALKNAVANQSFDSNKLMIAKQAVASNYLTAFQVAELADLMTFESNKLDFAKCAYKFTIDKNNYYLLNNVFSFSSSVYELNKYINSVG